MDVEITPEPTEEEREAILKALELEAAAVRSGRRTAAPEPWGDARVIQPGDPRQHDRDE
jgi:hypothetical protein